jgi:hypothetical protein
MDTAEVRSVQGPWHASRRARDDVDDAAPISIPEQAPVGPGAATSSPPANSDLTIVEDLCDGRAQGDRPDPVCPYQRRRRLDVAAEHAVSDSHGSGIPGRSRHAEGAERLTTVPVARGRDGIEGGRHRRRLLGAGWYGNEQGGRHRECCDHARHRMALRQGTVQSARRVHHAAMSTAASRAPVSIASAMTSNAAAHASSCSGRHASPAISASDATSAWPTAA